MIDRCLRCNAQVAASAASPVMGPQLHYHVSGPFPAVYDARTVACPSCHANHLVMMSSVSSLGHIVWPVAAQQMIEGADYVLANPIHRVSGKKPLVACWAWLPLMDDGALAGKLVAAIKSDEDLRRDDHETLLVLAYDEIMPDVMKVLPLFDSCALLKSHVVERPAGPYPSLRAEMSIQTTWSASALVKVKHYWPAASLDEANYVALSPDEELTQAVGKNNRKTAVGKSHRKAA